MLYSDSQTPNREQTTLKHIHTYTYTYRGHTQNLDLFNVSRHCNGPFAGLLNSNDIIVA